MIFLGCVHALVSDMRVGHSNINCFLEGSRVLMNNIELII